MWHRISISATNIFNLTDYISGSIQRMLIPCIKKGNVSCIAVLNLQN